MIPKLMPTDESENQLVADALKYAKSGLLVFPLHTVKDGKCTYAKSDCNSPAKHPRTIHGLKQASKDLNFVKNLFSSFNYLSANIAVCTGKESNLVVVDVDNAKGELKPALLKINSERCKPPLGEKEVLQIVHSVSRYEIQAQPQTKFNSEINAGDFPSLFKIQSASVWLENAKLRPVPKMLFGELWFEGELCILFADTGKGKSILAVQIGNSISKGASIGIFKLTALKQKVLYFDFELSDKQFEARYSIKQGDYFANHYAFDEKFKRGEINQSSFMPNHFKDFQEYLNYSLEYEIIQTDAKVLIVDNITYLKSATETAKDALPLMKELIRLKKKYDLSIMALAHTPKRDLSRPLTVNDLQGSKMLSNFADSIFAIGESAKDKNLRYLKQIKARNTEEIYHAENVAVCQIIKPDNFLMFEFLSFGIEREHLKHLSESDKADLIEKVKSFSAKHKTQREIANELGISLGAVNKYLNLKI